MSTDREMLEKESNPDKMHNIFEYREQKNQIKSAPNRLSQVLEMQQLENK